MAGVAAKPCVQMDVFFGAMEASSSAPDDGGKSASFLDVPLEVVVDILRLVDPVDVLSVSRTCKTMNKYADDQNLWKHQWVKLSGKTTFSFLPANSMAELGVNFKDACARLWRILVHETNDFGGFSPKKCSECDNFTCAGICSDFATVSIDIGGKMTWVMASRFKLEQHLTMVAVPKVLKCYDCDTTIPRDENPCDCGSNSASIRARPMSLCHNRLMSSHTALEYCSQPLSDIPDQPAFSQPFCLFCNEDQKNLMLCERDVVMTTRRKMKDMMADFEMDDVCNFSAVSPLASGYCQDTAAILGAHNLDLLSPLLAMDHIEAFPIVKTFLTHILDQNMMADSLQACNACIMFAVPLKLPVGVKEAFLKFFFEVVKTPRICLLPKPLAIAQIYKVKTCIVVDSGATSTWVSVVIDGCVDESKSQTVPVGGWHVSEYLKQAMAWKNKKVATSATVSSLDTSAVKLNCRLLLNLNREPAADYRAKTETLLIESQSDANRRLEMTEIALSSELYLAPEMMYASMNLPAIVNEATRDLPDHLKKDCLSNILLAGGNANLQGFSQRFSNDLRELLPEYSPVINVRPREGGDFLWNTVLGASTMKIPIPYDVLHLHGPGSALWMSREEYITFGNQLLANNDTLDSEG